MRHTAMAGLDGPEAPAGHHAYRATAPTCCAGWGGSKESRAAYGRAVGLEGNTAETAYLTRRRDRLR